jgi:methyl-accepting chemotaxis protein
MPVDAEVTELERRLSAALDRIGQALPRLAIAAAAAAAPPPRPAAGRDEAAALREALETERTANQQLAERLRAVKEQGGQSLRDAQQRIERLTRQLDVQGLELTRMRKATAQLRETVRSLTEAAARGSSEPHLVNKAMLAELEALRAQRMGEVAEMEEILGELAPALDRLDGEARAGA